MSSRSASCFRIVIGLSCLLSVPAYAQHATPPAAGATPSEAAPSEAAPSEANPAPVAGTTAVAPPPAEAPTPAPTYPAQPAYEAEPSNELGLSTEEEDLHRIGIFASPLSLIFGTLPVELDVRVARSLTLNGQLQFVKSGDLSGVGFAGGPQWFFTDKAFHGGYLFPTFQYAFVSGQGIDASAIGAGATVGYQWLWGAFGLRLGGGFVYYSASASDSETSVSLDGVFPVLDLSLGASF